MRDPSVLGVKKSVGIWADGHVSDMRDPLVMQSVLGVGKSIGIGADYTCQTCVSFGMCVKPSVIPSVFDVGKSVGKTSVNVAQSRKFFCNSLRNTDGLYSVGKSVSECGTIP
jgi:hypothetical protein